MSYEDVNDIKERLYDAYTKACVLIGNDQTVMVSDVEALATDRLKISVKIEVI